MKQNKTKLALGEELKKLESEREELGNKRWEALLAYQWWP